MNTHSSFGYSIASELYSIRYFVSNVVLQLIIEHVTVAVTVLTRICNLAPANLTWDADYPR